MSLILKLKISLVAHKRGSVRGVYEGILLDITHLNDCALHTPPGPTRLNLRQPPNIRFEDRLESLGEFVAFTPNLDRFSQAFPASLVLHVVLMNDSCGSDLSINSPETPRRNHDFCACFGPSFPPIPCTFDLQIVHMNDFCGSILDVCKHNFSFDLIGYTPSMP